MGGECLSGIEGQDERCGEKQHGQQQKSIVDNCAHSTQKARRRWDFDVGLWGFFRSEIVQLLAE